MSYAPTSDERRGHRAALIGGRGVAGPRSHSYQAGVVEPPDLEGALTDLSETLGAWTYALVGGLAFLETGAFVGLVAPGETAIVLGGVVAAEGEVDLPAMLAIAWVAAALGDLASYALGRRLGRRFLVDPRPARRRHPTPARDRRRLLRPPRRQGDPDRALRRPRARGRPVPGRRLELPLRGFVPWSLLGTALGDPFTLVGYAFHDSFSAAAGASRTARSRSQSIAAAALAWRAHRRSRAAAAA